MASRSVPRSQDDNVCYGSRGRMFCAQRFSRFEKSLGIRIREASIAAFCGTTKKRASQTSCKASSRTGTMHYLWRQRYVESYRRRSFEQRSFQCRVVMQKPSFNGGQAACRESRSVVSKKIYEIVDAMARRDSFGASRKSEPSSTLRSFS